MSFKKPLYKNKFCITILIVILLQVLLAFQGFDVCDDGFVLTFYQQIFSNPESVEYSFLYWFSGIVGGLWYQLYEDGGILWFRILGIIVNTSTFIVSYKLLKKHIPQHFLLIGLAMVLFVNDYGFLTFYHNHLTALMMIIAICVLYKAITNKNNVLFVLAGFIIGLNVFTRLPNLVLFILVLTIPFYYFLLKIKLVKSIKSMILFGLGIVIAFVSVYFALIALNQLDVMKNSIMLLNDLGNTTDSAHNFTDVITSQFGNYKSLIKALLEFLVIVGVYYGLTLIIKNKLFTKFGLPIIVGACFIYWLNRHGIFSIYMLALVGSILVILNKRRPLDIRIISFMSLLVLLTLSIGTGGGIFNSGYMAIWLGLPLFFYSCQHIDYFLEKLKIGNQKNFRVFNKASVSKFLWILALAFLILKSYKISKEAYFDKGSRLDKTIAINNSRAKGVYTTERRAKIINDVLDELKNHVKPNDFLFTYQHIPMLHFLTETKPYAYNSWVGIYDSNSFQKKINKAEQEIDELPVVVRQKFRTIIDFSEPLDDYMSTKKENTFYHNNELTAVMNDFLDRNDYVVVWSNSYFNIYKSKKTVE